MKKELKDILERAKILCHDLEDYLIDKQMLHYNVEAARKQLVALRMQFQFLGDGTLKGFPHEVLPENKKKKDPKWVVMPMYEDPETKLIPAGFSVAWSEPDPVHGHLLVRHYWTDREEGSPSLGWCENAAERNAKDFNEQFRGPWEFK